MVEKSKIISGIHKSTETLIQHLSRFTDTNFNQRPANDVWSAGEVAEHILLLERKINNNLQDGYAAARQPDEKATLIKEFFENTDCSLKAYQVIQPSTNPKNQHSLKIDIKTERTVLSSILQTTDLAETTTIKHPQMGDFTRLEWSYFIIYHTELHFQQLNKLFAKLS